jgi:hypothetical protein
MVALHLTVVDPITPAHPGFFKTKGAGGIGENAKPPFFGVLPKKLLTTK